MERIQIFKIRYMAVVSSSFGVFTTVLYTYLQARINIALSIAFSIGFLYLFVSCFRTILESSIEKFRAVRKIIIGSRFVEGYWVDYAISSEGKITSSALLNIFYEDGGLKVSAIVAWPNDRRIDVFSSDLILMNRSNLHFRYELFSENRNRLVDRGYEEIQFQLYKKIPDSYTGYFFSENNASATSIHGIKIENVKLIKEFSDSHKRVSYLRNYLKKAINEFTHVISSDLDEDNSQSLSLQFK